VEAEIEGLPFVLPPLLLSEASALQAPRGTADGESDDQTVGTGDTVCTLARQLNPSGRKRPVSTT